MRACARCGTGRARRNGLCAACQLLAYAQLQKKKYVWTEELLAELREAYVGDRQHLSRGLDRLVQKTGWARHAFLNKAVALRITRVSAWRNWTSEDDNYLRAMAGVLTTARIAKKLRRSCGSVRQRMQQLKGSLRLREGYTVSDLSAVFKTTREFLTSRLEKGYFGQIRKDKGYRVSEEAVARFLVQHPHEYDLRCIDQAWFKAVLFGHNDRIQCDYDRIKGGH